MEHIYAVASGFSRRVVPVRVPIEFTIVGDATLVATPSWRNAPAVLRVVPDTPSEKSTSSDRAADVVDGPARREWWIETTVYAVPLPRGWTAIVSGDVSPAFDLVAGECAIYIQTATRRRGIDDLAAPNQSEIARGQDDHAEWIDLSYVHDDRLWIQRHSLLRSQPNAMITVQGPADDFWSVHTVHGELSRRAKFV